MRSSVIALLVPATLLALTTGCDRWRARRQALADVHYVVGPPWLGDGCWFYPGEQTSYMATGLAVIDAPRPKQKSRTADGEPYDPTSFTASHQTLQLPVVLHVRNLENGRVVTVRVNDRGPASPGRLLSVTPAVARLLGMIPAHATRVQLVQDERLSDVISRTVKDAPVVDLVAAPVTAVQERSLTSPNTVSPLHSAALLPLHELEPSAAEPVMGTLTQGVPDRGRLWIDAGHFNQRFYARRLSNSLSGTVRQEGEGRSATFSVRLGPFDFVSQADAALDRARAGGVTDARIIVE